MLFGKSLTLKKGQQQQTEELPKAALNEWKECPVPKRCLELAWTLPAQLHRLHYQHRLTRVRITTELNGAEHCNVPDQDVFQCDCNVLHCYSGRGTSLFCRMCPG